LEVAPIKVGLCNFYFILFFAEVAMPRRIATSARKERVRKCGIQAALLFLFKQTTRISPNPSNFELTIVLTFSFEQEAGLLKKLAP
jgi:hypothetical protein